MENKIIRYSISKVEFLKMNTATVEYKIIMAKGYVNKLSFISGLNPSLVSLIFGKCDFKYRGSEYTTDNWGLEFCEHKFILVSANGRGTSVESECEDNKIIKNFYDVLVDMFISINNPKIDSLKVLLNK